MLLFSHLKKSLFHGALFLGRSVLKLHLEWNSISYVFGDHTKDENKRGTVRSHLALIDPGVAPGGVRSLFNGRCYT